MAKRKPARPDADNGRTAALDVGELPARPKDGADGLDRHRFYIVEPVRYGNDGGGGAGHHLRQRGLRAERPDHVLRWF